MWSGFFTVDIQNDNVLGLLGNQYEKYYLVIINMPIKGFGK